MPKLPLHGRGRVVVGHALVDEDDLPKLERYTWGLHNQGYAAAVRKVAGKTRHVLLHRLLMGLKKGDGMEVDFINGDKLDCWRSNLRVCTPGENKQNRPAQSNNTSGYKGVTWDKPKGRWRAQIMANGTRHFLGLFTDVEEAAAAYAEAAERLHGGFANTNVEGEDR